MKEVKDTQNKLDKKDVMIQKIYWQKGEEGKKREAEKQDEKKGEEKNIN